MTRNLRLVFASVGLAGLFLSGGAQAQTASPQPPHHGTSMGQADAGGCGMDMASTGSGTAGQSAMCGRMRGGERTAGRGMMGRGTMMSHGMMGQGMMGHGMMGERQSPAMPPMMQGRQGDMPTDHIEGRIAFMRAELRITEAQTPAWTEFANVVRSNAQRLVEERRAQAQRLTTTATDRMDDQERALAVRLESLRALKPAYGKLQAVLDDKQKQAADQMVGAYLGG